MFNQLLTPVGDSLFLSFLVATIPIIVVLVMLGVLRRPAWQAALAGLAVALVIAIGVWQMPVNLAVSSTAAGVAFALWPIMWIVFSALILYNTAVLSGRFDAFRRWVLMHLPQDKRIVLVVIGYGFGSLLEGVSGFGAPVAITASLLIMLGFRPIDAVVYALIFNTAPVAFGSLGIPITTLAGVTDLPAQTLGAMVGRQLPFFAFLLPFYVVAMYGGMRSVKALWPVLLVAVVLMKSIFWAEDFASFVQNLTRLPRYLRPAVAGAMLGGLAIWFPHIIGVGYETTTAALTGSLLLHEAIVFVALKVLAVAITIGGRMGGGVFSPSLMIGALTGLAFGLIATSVFPNVSGEGSLYALAGMGAVAAAVLGAPISTTLIVFELTGDWQTGLAVMVAVSLSTALASRLVDRSFFLTQLERRGVHLAAGPQAYLLATIPVIAHLRDAPEDGCKSLIQQGFFLDRKATLEQAMPLFDRSGAAFLPIVSEGKDSDTPMVLGVLYQLDALRAMNRALSDTAAEEHS